MHLHPLRLVGQSLVDADSRQQTTSFQFYERHPIILQLDHAFTKQPDLSGIIHGVRKVRRGCRGRRTSLFTSVKSEASFLLESGPELDYALLLEQNARVLSFRTQAIEIALPGEGYAYPDFAIKLDSGYEIHEVKASLGAQNRNVVKRFEIIRRQLESCGVGFTVVEADSFPSGEDMRRLKVAYSRGHAIPFSGTEVTVASQHLGTKCLASKYAAYGSLADIKAHPGIADFLWFHGQLQFGSSDLKQGKEAEA